VGWRSQSLINIQPSPYEIAHSLFVWVVGRCFGLHVDQQSSRPDQRVCFSLALSGFIHEWLLKLNSGSSSQFHTTTDWDRGWSGVVPQQKQLPFIMNKGKITVSVRKPLRNPTGIDFGKKGSASPVSWSNTFIWLARQRKNKTKNKSSFSKIHWVMRGWWLTGNFRGVIAIQWTSSKQTETCLYEEWEMEVNKTSVAQLCVGEWRQLVIYRWVQHFSRQITPVFQWAAWAANSWPIGMRLFLLGDKMACHSSHV